MWYKCNCEKTALSISTNIVYFCHTNFSGQIVRKTLFFIFLVLLVGMPANGRDKRQAILDGLLIDAVRLLDAGDVKGAEARIDAALGENPSSDALHYYKARCAAARSDKDTAEKHFTKAAQLDSTNLWYQSSLADFYATSGNHKKASELYLKLLESHPEKYSNAYTYTLLADRNFSERRDSLALVNYENALLYDPTYTPALLGKAEVYWQRRNIPAYFSIVDPFVRDPEVYPSAKCSYVKAVLNAIDGRFYRDWHPQLDSLVTGCLSAHPTDSSALQLAASWFYATGRRDKCQAYVDQLVQAYPDNAGPRFFKIQLMNPEEDAKAVIAECEFIAAMPSATRSERISALTIMGDTYHQSGDKKKAYSYYEKVLQIDPEYVPVLNNYAYFLCLDGKKLKRAEEMSKITVDKNPDNPTYLDTYGWILFLRGRAAEAKPYFKHAMLYGGKDSKEVLLHYSAVLHELGEEDLSLYYKGLADQKK